VPRPFVTSRLNREPTASEERGVRRIGVIPLVALGAVPEDANFTSLDGDKTFYILRGILRCRQRPAAIDDRESISSGYMIQPSSRARTSRLLDVASGQHLPSNDQGNKGRRRRGRDAAYFRLKSSGFMKKSATTHDAGVAGRRARGSD